MQRQVLRDDQWERIKDLLPGKASDCGVTAKDNRLFLEAVLWMVRTGSPWRDLPERFGHWLSIFEALADDPDFEYLMMDGSIVRVHQPGAAKKNSRNKKRWASHGAG